MAFGSIVFFIPPWSAAILYPEAPAAYANLGDKAADAAYLIFAQNAMPVGTVGLLMAGLFAATMSSMDSSLNKASGIFVRSVYQPIMAKRGVKPSEKSLLRIGMAVSLICGALVIMTAIFFQSLKQLSLFELMMQVSTLVEVPLLVPLLLGLFIKRTPSWAPWATVAVGLCVSWLMLNILTPQYVADLIGLETLTRREVVDFGIILTIAAHLLLTAGFFCATTLLYKSDTDKNLEETNRFFDDLLIPVIADNRQDEYDRQQREKLGLMVKIMGGALLAMALIPNPMFGRLIFVACAAVVITIGWALSRGARAKQ